MNRKDEIIKEDGWKRRREDEMMRGTEKEDYGVKEGWREKNGNDKLMEVGE